MELLMVIKKAQKKLNILLNILDSQTKEFVFNDEESRNKKINEIFQIIEN